MEGTDPDVDRRTVLRTTAVGIGALALPGVAAADPGKGRGKGRGRGRRGPPEHAQAPFTVEDGRVHPTSQTGNARAAEMAARASAPGESDGPEIQLSLEERTEMLNEAAEAGVIELDEQDGMAVAQFTGEGA